MSLEVGSINAGSSSEGRKPRRAMIRRTTEQDFDSLSDIYYRAVDRLLRDFCGDVQIRYYLRFARDRSKFRPFIEDSEVWVFEIDSVPVAFCGVQTDGHISSVYVNPGHSRSGIGSALVNHVIRLGRQKGTERFFTEANSLPKHFFEKLGFVVMSKEVKLRGEIPFERYNMEIRS
jgi:putative acetyltransferase